MSPAALQYLLPVLSAGLACIAMAIYARRRGMAASGPFTVLMLAVAVWAFGYALEIASGTLPGKMVWGKVKYAGVVAVGWAWFWFACRFTGRLRWQSTRNLFLLALFPALTLALVWTNGVHGLIWQDVRLERIGPLLVKKSAHGRWFWIHTVYGYGLMLAGSLIMLHTLFRSGGGPYRRQAAVVLVGVAAPWVGNVLYLIRLSPLPGLDPTPFGFAVTGIAVALGLSRARFLDILPLAREVVVENIRDGIVVLDEKNRVREINPAGKRILGLDGDHLIGMPMERVFPEWVDWNTASKDQLEIVIPGEGRENVYELFISAVTGSKDRIVSRVALLHDVTERKRTEAELRRAREGLEERVRERTAELQRANEILRREMGERVRAEAAVRSSEARYRRLVENAPGGILELDLDRMRVLSANEAMCRITRRDRVTLLCEDPLALFGEEGRVRLLNCRSRSPGKGDPSAFESRFRSPSGEESWAVVNLHVMAEDDRPERGLIVAQDITERKRMELGLQNAQKMEAIGTLAGGIAHDFNNLLTSIQGNTSLLLMDFPSGESRDMLESIERCVQQGAGLTQQLLGIARGGKYNPRPFRILDLLKRSSGMFGRTNKDVRVHLELEEEPINVLGEEGQVEQVLLNLFLNAAQAMPGGGELYLGLGRVVIEETEAAAHGVQTGGYARITIRDTGAGMDEETRKRAFDPFFTTKTRGRGTGLGLSSAYGIVRNHGGFMDLESEIGVGSTFRVFLPETESDVPDRPLENRGVKGGAGTVLLVDDEEIILDVAEKMLKRLGYGVLRASGGREAVRIYGAQSDAIDLVILDIIMPGMGGKETFEALHDLDPDVRVLLSSGYSLEGRAKEILKMGCVGFIQKPYDVGSLSEGLREAMQG